MNNMTLEAFGHFDLYVVIFLLVLALLWSFLPFAIFGTKPKLDELIRQMQQTNTELGRIRERLSQPVLADNRSPEVPSEPTKTPEQLMDDFGITFENGKYTFEKYHYDKLEDAVNYAKTMGY